MPFVEKERYQISRRCRLHADNDLYRDQEQHKIRVDVNEWKCGYCRKRFYEEIHLDQHFDNRHYDLLNVVCDAIFPRIDGNYYYYYYYFSENLAQLGCKWQIIQGSNVPFGYFVGLAFSCFGKTRLRGSQFVILALVVEIIHSESDDDDVNYNCSLWYENLCLA